MSNNEENEIGDLFQSMVSEGIGLHKAFNTEQTIQEKHITLIRGWINQAISLIEPSMPPDSEEFKKLCKIKEMYSSVVNILPGDTSEHILQMIESLNMAYEYFKTWCDFDWSKIAPEDRINVCHGALVKTWLFSRNRIIGSLQGKEDGRTKRTAFLHSFGRMYCLVHSMVNLGNKDDLRVLVAEHNLALAGCLRAILEIFLDINLLARNIVDRGPEKFFSFENVERHRIAKNSLQLHEEYKHLSEDQLDRMKSYADGGSDAEIRMNDLIIGLWGVTKREKPNRPSHWTGMTVIQRVKNLGKDYVRYYQHSYHYCNWSLHSGYTDFLMANKEIASLFCAHIYNLANKMFTLAIDVLIDELPEILNVEDLKSEFKKVQLCGAQLLWDATVKANKNKM